MSRLYECGCAIGGDEPLPDRCSTHGLPAIAELKTMREWLLAGEPDTGQALIGPPLLNPSEFHETPAGSPWTDDVTDGALHSDRTPEFRVPFQYGRVEFLEDKTMINVDHLPYADPAVKCAVMSAVLAERERCALIAERAS